MDTAPELHFLMSRNLAGAGRISEALAWAQKALVLAEARGDSGLAETIKEGIADYRQKTGSIGQTSTSKPELPSSR